MPSRDHTSALMASVCLVLLALFGLNAAAETFYVCQATGDDGDTGLDWDTAFRTLQTALAAADMTPEQDTIRVAEGDYSIASGEIPAGVALIGGYPSGGGVRDPSVFTCRLNLSDCLLEGLQVNDDSTLDGLEVLGCSGRSDDRDRYGIFVAGSRVTVRNCRVHAAHGDTTQPLSVRSFAGIGILTDVQSTDVVIQDNEIYDNCGGWGQWGAGGAGYGIKVGGTGIRIVGNNIHNNDGGSGGLPIDTDGTPSGDGHGIWADGEDLVISGNIIRENDGPGSAWADIICAPAGDSFGVSVKGRNIEISHNEIYSHAGGRGGDTIESAWLDLHAGGDGGGAFAIRIHEAQSVVVFDNLISGVYGGYGGSAEGTPTRGGDAGRAAGIIAETSQCDMGNNTVAEVHPGLPGLAYDDPGEPAQGDGFVFTGMISPAVLANNIAYMYEDYGFTGELLSTDFTNNIAWADTGTPFDGGPVDPSNTSEDPSFVPGPGGEYYLSQVAAGQGLDSPCVDGGNDTADAVGLADRTTRSDDGLDQGVVDQGYHYRPEPSGNEPFLLRNDMVTSLDPLTPPKNLVLPLETPRDLYAFPVTSPVTLMNEMAAGSSPLVFYAVGPDSTLRAVKMDNDLAIIF